MGDIIRKVEVCSLTEGGKRGRCETVDALIDTGASSTVISDRLAARLGGASLPTAYHATIEGKAFPRKLTSVKLKERACGLEALAVVVSNTLVARAARPVEVVLGHDYLQRKRVALMYDEDVTKQKAVCRGRSR
jgi:predicted aspartyl protease